ncbi:uncharacterized protein LOC110984661 isoform X2 [Acanthaster planci]|nr:uncharacterized protein LOC110984661 isoform X2 [Acanthaster planci]XP_022100749.1 uncharacterized protein LOC110984661 isoform X2 [Acanthaster planci]XP_022100750.1 uncharacterized protein LOC110984661 isoform X2 [Acanthaster planci]
MNPTGQPAVVMSSSAGEIQPSAPRKKVPGLKGFSVVHIVLAVLSIIFGILAVVFECNFSYAGWGIWSGILFFLVTGILGLATRKQNSKRGLVIAFMVMSILSSIVAFQLMVASVIAAPVEFYYYCHPYPRGLDYNYYCGFHMTLRQAIDALLGIVGLAELTISVVTASLSCYGVCQCCNPYTPVMVQYVPQQTHVQFMPMSTMEAPMSAMQGPQHQQAGIQLATTMNTQQQPQQQPLQMQAAMQGAPYVTNYSATPTQEMTTSPQEVGGGPVAVGLPHDDKEGLLH